MGIHQSVSAWCLVGMAFSLGGIMASLLMSIYGHCYHNELREMSRLAVRLHY
jgi:hypothetical protein